jgi:predicted MPP superfamily phosphohydrolase
MWFMRLRSFASFLIVYVTATLLGYIYVAHRLAGESFLGWSLLAIPYFSVLSYPLIVISDRKTHRFAWAKQLAFYSLGLTTYLTLLTLLAHFFSAVTGRDIAARWILLGTCVCLVIGSLIAVYGPWVKKLSLSFENLPPALKGFRIVQISDLHISGSIGVDYVKRVIEKTNALNPDLIALTGDIVDGSIEEFKDLVSDLKALKAKHGVFYVPGNHEYYWGVDDWIQVFSEIGRPLLNENFSFTVADARIAVAGTTDAAARQVGHDLKPDFPKASQGIETANFKILLAHRPGIAERAADSGFDLQLSGHTHGGQFFPWTIVIRAVHRYSQGRYLIRRMWVYVNPGTGSWGPMLRLGTVPELTCIELE